MHKAVRIAIAIPIALLGAAVLCVDFVKYLAEQRP